jgi:hypothetical protein
LNLVLMRLIDEQLLETPFHDARQMARPNAAPALNSLIKPPTVRTNGATSVQMELPER